MPLSSSVLKEGTEVVLQDSTNPPFEFEISQKLGAVTVVSTMASGTNTITMSPGHGFTVGDKFEAYTEEEVLPGFFDRRFQQLPVIAVAGDVITFGTFSSTTVSPTTLVEGQRTNTNMAVLGSLGSPVRFSIVPPNGLIWDATRVMITMILSGSPDDALFGSLPALTNGMFFGFEGDLFNAYLVHIVDNAGFRRTAYDVTYTTRSGGGGNWGLACRKSFSGQDKYGAAVRLDGNTNDEFIAYIQDDVTGLVEFKITLMGHRETPIIAP